MDYQVVPQVSDSLISLISYTVQHEAVNGTAIKINGIEGQGFH